MTTLLQLRRMVRNRLGVTASDSFFRDDMMDDAINAAIATFESERNWPWQLRSVNIEMLNGDGIVPLPADWRATRAVYWDRYEVSQVPPYELYPYNNEPGNPQSYALIGNELHVRNVPPVGAIIQLLYYRAPTLLNADSDSPDMPGDTYPAIVAKAAQLSSTREDDRPSAQSHLVEYEQWLQRLMNTGESNRRPVGRRIRPGPWV